MPITLGKLAELIDGQIANHHQDQQIKGIKSLEEAGVADISFYSNDKYKNHLDETKACAVILDKTNADIASYKWIPIMVDNVPLAISKVLSHFADTNKKENSISTSAQIHETASVHANVHIGHYTIIEEGASIEQGVVLMGNNYIAKGAIVGENTVLYPGVNVLASCEIGKNCIVQSNTVIGSEGFGYVFEDNKFHKIPHIGNVVIEDDVEIGSNCTIDRASIGTTRIKQGAKLDNLIQIAHNVEIGNHTAMAAQSGVAGSTKIGSYCQIGGQVGIVGHISIADNTRIQAQSGVSRTIKENGTKLYGSPAIDYNNYLRSYAGFKNLPDMIKKLRELEDKIIEIQAENEAKNNSTKD